MENLKKLKLKAKGVKHLWTRSLKAAAAAGQQERETGQLLYIERRVNCKQTEDTETGKQRKMRQGRIAKKTKKQFQQFLAGRIEYSREIHWIHFTFTVTQKRRETETF